MSLEHAAFEGATRGSPTPPSPIIPAGNLGGGCAMRSVHILHQLSDAFAEALNTIAAGVGSEFFRNREGGEVHAVLGPLPRDSLSG